MRSRRLVPTLAAGALLALAGCGGGGSEDASTTAAPATLPFPPTAFEPGTGPREQGVPSGTAVRTGGRAEGIAVDPETHLALVGVKRPGGDTLDLIDVRSGRLVRRISVPGAPRHVVLGEPGGPFLAPLEDANALAIVDPRTGRDELVRDVGDHPHDATWADGTAYVANEFDATVSVVRDGRVVRKGTVDAQPGGIRAVGDQLAVISVRAYTVELLDRDTLAQGGSQNVGYGPSHVVTDGSRLYVADTRGNGISVFDTRPQLRFAARVPVPDSPYGMAIDAQRKRLWVTRTAANAVAEIDLSGRTPRLVRSLPTIQQPNTVGVDPTSGRLAVASATAGAVQLLDP
jgi:DNA-binding beta-propeller fold protein YncE